MSSIDKETQQMKQKLLAAENAIDITTTEKYKADNPFKKQVDRYIWLQQFRRNLRQAHRLVESANILLDHIKNHITTPNTPFAANSKAKENNDHAMAYIQHAITLYSRYFKSTNGKKKAKKEDYFANNSTEMEYHEEIIDLRDQCVAHPEKDYFEEDLALISKSETKLYSKWINSYDNNLLNKLTICIETVHNYINANDIHRAEKSLEKKCAEYQLL